MSRNEDLDSSARVLLVLAELADLFRGNLDLLAETWGALTCNEVEKFALIFRLAGHEDVAAGIIEGHGAYDEEGDAHHPPRKASPADLG